MQTTFPRLLLNHATQRPAEPAMREKEYGIWQALSWADLAALVEHLACGLHQAGLRRNEHMIVVGANRPRLYATMLAAQSLGAIPIPLYQDAAAAECVFPINNADVRFAFAEDQEQVDKLLEIREQLPLLQHIWFDDPRGLRKYDEPGLAATDGAQHFEAAEVGAEQEGAAALVERREHQALADRLGVDAELVVPSETVALIRKNRAQAQAQAAQTQQAEQQAKTMQALGNTPIDGALASLVSGSTSGSSPNSPKLAIRSSSRLDCWCSVQQ